jgi:anti-anti-sigma regulatory factor
VEGILDRSTTPPTLRLGGELRIDSAAELQTRLLEALAFGQPIQVALEAVTGLDVSGLQLLTAAESAAERRGGAWLRNGAVPESLRRTAEEAGWERVPFAGNAQGQD